MGPYSSQFSWTGWDLGQRVAPTEFLLRILEFLWSEGALLVDAICG